MGKENSNSNQQFTSTAKRRLKEIPRRCALPHKQQPFILMHPSIRLWEHLREQFLRQGLRPFITSLLLKKTPVPLGRTFKGEDPQPSSSRDARHSTPPLPCNGISLPSTGYKRAIDLRLSDPIFPVSAKAQYLNTAL